MSQTGVVSESLAPAVVQTAGAADYFALLKPRVMSLVVFTGLVGIVVAPSGLHPVLAFTALLCIAVGAGASGAINMWFDADIDAKMRRTQNRPVPAGRVQDGYRPGRGYELLPVWELTFRRGEAHETWRARVDADTDLGPEERAAAMDGVNPLYIPRNHKVEEALEAASQRGDLEPTHSLLELFADPYNPRDGREEYSLPATPEFTSCYRTFCGT